MEMKLDFLLSGYKILKLGLAKYNIFDTRVEFIYAVYSSFLSKSILHKSETNNLRTFYNMFIAYWFYTRDHFYIEVRI